MAARRGDRETGGRTDKARLVEHPVPQDEGAEQATLGAMLTERQAISHVVGLLSPEDFYHPRHRCLYEAMSDLYGQDQPVDVVTVQSWLREHSTEVEVVDSSYLVDLTEAAPTAAAVETYATAVKRTATQRRLRMAALAVAEAPHDSTRRSALALALESGTMATGRRVLTWEQILTQGHGVTWVLSPYLVQGGVTCIAGEPGDGKSFFGLSLCHAVATGQPWLGKFPVTETGPALYVDAETNPDWVRERLQQFQPAAEVWQGAPDVSFHFGVDVNLGDGLARLRPIVKQRRPKLVVFDSLSCLLPDGVDENSNSAMTQLMRGLKDFAYEHGFAALTIHHQRKRQGLGDNSGRARVRGASAIVAVLDVLCTLRKDSEDTILVTFDKTRLTGPQPPFRVAFQPGEEGGTTLAYAGDVDNRNAKRQLARELILGALDSDEKDRKTLVGLLAENGIGRPVADGTLEALCDEGLIDRGNDGNSHVYWLR